jgi:hypothetical protein
MAMQRYQVIGYDAEDGRPFDLTIEAPNKAVVLERWQSSTRE